jgi:hypothetical protein
MMKIDSDAATLLVSYEVGCANQLVRDKRMDPQFARGITQKVFERLPMTEGDAQKFGTDYLKCSSLAKRLGKKSIDTETIRTYFFKPSEHSKFVEDSFKADLALGIKWDFDPSECKAQQGSVIKVDKGFALVKAVIDGKETVKECRNPIPDIAVGAYVVFHRGYIAEELNAEVRALMDKLRIADSINADLLKSVFKHGKIETKLRVKS